ncbi:MAG: hypothetical protein WCK59_02955 [Candidatus Falkowbacteria bacterium]
MEKVTILVCSYPCGDPYYAGRTYSWQELPYLDSQEKKDKQEKKFYRTHEYWGESLSFLDAIKIDKKIFIDIEGLIGSEAASLGVPK